MGILDELNIRVEEVRAEQLRRDSELEAQEIFYRDHLRPLMLQAHQYLSEIVYKLNIVAPEIKPSYPLKPLSNQSITLEQSDYQIDFDSKTSPHQIDVTCLCALDQPQEFFVPTQDAASRFTDLLHSYNFPHHRKDRLNSRFEVSGATFFLEGPMRVHIRILADAAGRCIQTLLYNLEEPPFKRYKFTPDTFTPEILERLAFLLVREEKVLVEVVVSQDYRDRLRLQLEEEKRRNEEDLATAFAELESQRLEEENAKFLNRAKRFVSERSGRALSFIKHIRDRCIVVFTKLSKDGLRK
jgi:hypothetical protein